METLATLLKSTDGSDLEAEIATLEADLNDIFSKAGD